MSVEVTIQTLEELHQFMNEHGVIEIVTRDKGKKLKTYFNVAIDKLKQSGAEEKAKEVIDAINKNTEIGEKALAATKNIAKMNTVNLVLSGLNLCATCAGFIIMNEKLNAMSAQINDVIAKNKTREGVHLDFEFNKILSDHTNMLDARRTKKAYSTEKLLELVTDEYNVLRLLMDSFKKDTSSGEDQVFSMLSLASMLSATLRFYDEAYYFENKDSIDDGEVWHIAHKDWTKVFDDLTAEEFVNKIQDYCLLTQNLSTCETDYLYIGFLNQVKGLKQDIEDNQELILAVDDPGVLKVIAEQTSKEVREQIEKIYNSLENGAFDQEIHQQALRVAVA